MVILRGQKSHHGEMVTSRSRTERREEAGKGESRQCALFSRQDAEGNQAEGLGVFQG